MQKPTGSPRRLSDLQSAGFAEEYRQIASAGASLHVMGDICSFADEVKSCAVRMAESGVAALAGLFDLTSQRLVRYAATITRNQHDAEDAVQAALVQVARQIHRFCQTEHPWPYLLRIVRNEALVIVRRRRRWSLITNLSDLLTRRSVDEIELEDSYRAVWSALRSLPTNQAEVVVLKIWEDLTFAQIADILEISACTVASRYRYAMQKLSQKLTPAVAEVFRE